MQDSPPEPPRRRGAFASLVAELRRRRVNRVAGIYLAGALAVIGLGSDVLDNLGMPPAFARWLTLLVIAGFPVAVAVSWVYDFRVDREQEPAGRPYSAGLRGALILAGGVAVGMAMMVAVAFLSRESRAAGDAEAGSVPGVGVLPIQVAEEGEGAWLAHVLEGSVTEALAESRGVSMRSQELVAGYAHLPPDSVARVLRTRYLVSARLLTTGSQSRLSVQVLDTAGTLVGSAATFVAGPPSIAAAEELTQLARDHVLGTLGTEVRAARWRFATRSDEAFNLLYQADELIGQARAAVSQRRGADAADGVLDEADALLLRSVEADPDWSAPLLLRARLANVRAYALASSQAPPRAIEAALDSGIAITSRLLERRPGEAEAVALRGVLQYRKAAYLQLEPEVREQVLARAETDLREALRLDPDMAAAAAELGQLLYGRADFEQARVQSKRALKLDAYVADAAAVTQRLAMATFEEGLDGEALDLCRQGLQRFGDPSFHGCAIEVFAFGDLEPDVPGAWRHLHSLRANPLLAPRTLAYYEVQLAAVLGRANQRDSAQRVLARALSAHPDAFAPPEMMWLEAAVRFRLGQVDSATRLLRSYATSGGPGLQFNLSRRALVPYRQLLAIEPPGR